MITEARQAWKDHPFSGPDIVRSKYCRGAFVIADKIRTQEAPRKIDGLADSHCRCATNGSPLGHIGQNCLCVGRGVIDSGCTRRIPVCRSGGTEAAKVIYLVIDNSNIDVAWSCWHWSYSVPGVSNNVEL
jgi:hypothetical protein